jgi:hypothetical protein
VARALPARQPRLSAGHGGARVRAPPVSGQLTRHGGRVVRRLILTSVTFGYRSPEHEEADLAAFRELLAG